jgi:hypothetical protein
LPDCAVSYATRLDAIHLAAAAQIKRELTAFVTYDYRLLDGCREVGLATASPGGPLGGFVCTGEPFGERPGFGRLPSLAGL